MFGHRAGYPSTSYGMPDKMESLFQWVFCFSLLFFGENLVYPWRFHGEKKSDPVFKFGKALVLGLHCNWARSHLPPGTGPY